MRCLKYFTLVILFIFFFSQSRNGILAFYNPSDSTIYGGMLDADPETGDYQLWAIRYIDQGSAIERSPEPLTGNLNDGILVHATSDNIPGHIWGVWGQRTMVTLDGGDNWEISNIPLGNGKCGENAGESFLISGNANGEGMLLTTTDSWESWDTSYVPEYWDFEHYRVSFGWQNGHLLRTRYNTNDSPEFSSDTGRTWVTGYGEMPVSGLHYISAEDEIYQMTNMGAVFCIQDSGRSITEVFSVLDYGPYEDPNEPLYWTLSGLVTTNIPGEFYFFIDSTNYYDDLYYAEGDGPRFDLFHVTNYGRNVEIYAYYLINFEPRPPVSVHDRGQPVPALMSLSVFPNPANGAFNVDIRGLADAGQIEMYDLMGRRVSHLDLAGSSTRQHVSSSQLWVNSDLSSGNYYIILQSGDCHIKQTVVIVK